MKYVVFGPPYGSLEECLKKKKYHFNNLIDMLMFVVDNSSVINDEHTISFNDLSICRYCFDDELKKHIYVICTDRLADENYIEKFGHPRAYKYFIDLDDSLSDISFLEYKSNYN